MKIRLFSSFADLPPDVVEVYSYPAQQNFFSSIDWYSCLYETVLSNSKKQRIYYIQSIDNEPLAVAACCTPHKKPVLSSMTSFYSIMYAPLIIAPGAPAQSALETFVNHICLEEPRWDVIEFRYLTSEKTILTLLDLYSKSGRFAAQRYFQYHNWYLDVGGRDFKTYYAQRSSRLRNTISRREKKLSRDHRYNIEIYTTLDDDLELAINHYIEIYNNSWKNPEPFPDFIPNLIKTAAQAGVLRLGILYIRSNPAAAQIWITTRGTAIIYKLAYNDEYSAYSPGSILSHEMFRYAIDNDRVNIIDYGIGSEGYKRDWMESVRNVSGIRALNRSTIKGSMLIAEQRIKAVAKNFMAKPK